LLLHAVVALLPAIWVRDVAPPPLLPASPIEIVFQLPAEPAPDAPPVPPVAAAPPAPAIPPPEQAEAAPPPPVPPPPQPVEAEPPTATLPIVEPAPQAPPVTEALPTPPLPLPPPPETSRPPPKPLQASRPQPRPVAPPRPAAPEPVPSAPSAPAATAIPAPAEPPAPISSDWRQALAAWLAAHKTYPEVARRRGEQGSVALRFSVERSGRVADVTVERGSGSAVLDAAAEAMLRNATVPAFPAAMAQDRISVTVQIRFRLTD
jgi:protein TonB